jgi:hypothetical protein
MNPTDPYETGFPKKGTYEKIPYHDSVGNLGFRHLSLVHMSESSGEENPSVTRCAFGHASMAACCCWRSFGTAGVYAIAPPLFTSGGGENSIASLLALCPCESCCPADEIVWSEPLLGTSDEVCWCFFALFEAAFNILAGILFNWHEQFPEIKWVY